MSGPENTFIAGVHRHLPPKDDLHREKMNNPYSSGTADMWYSGPSGGRDLWVEYKFLLLPKRDTTVIDLTTGSDPPLSALQQDWLKRRHDEGRNVWVIVGFKEGGVLFVGREWEKPHTTAQYRGWMLRRDLLAEQIQSFVERK